MKDVENFTYLAYLFTPVYHQNLFRFTCKSPFNLRSNHW